MKIAVYKDNSKAEQIKAICLEAKNTVQAMYNELKETGTEFNVNEMLDIWQIQAGADAVKEMIIDKKLNGETPELYGMKISREKLFTMIEIENINAIQATYLNVPFSYATHINANYARELLSITDGVVKLAPDYETQIDELCTFYATTEAQASKIEKLVNASNALNELDGILTPNWREDIEGLQIKNGKYEPDYKVIAEILKR